MHDEQLALTSLDELREIRAQVVSVNDPGGLMRVQVRIPGVCDGILDKQLPWSEYKLLPGFRPGDGEFKPVKVGDWVWVDWTTKRFDLRYLRVVGSCHFAPNGVPNFPLSSYKGEGEFVQKRTAKQPAPLEAAYHRDVVTHENNVQVELVDGGGYRVTDTLTGTSLEFVGGKVVIHAESDMFQSTEGALEVEVKGDANVTIEGNTTLDAKEDVTATIGGDLDVTTDGTTNISSTGPINAESDSLVKIKAPKVVVN